MQIFKNANYDFVRWRWHAIVLSSVVILAGLASTIARGASRSASTSPAARIVIVQVRAGGAARTRSARRSTSLPGEKVVQQVRRSRASTRS